MESKLQKKIIERVKRAGYYVVKTVLSNRSGVPDLLFCAKGRFYGIEIKEPGKLPSELQKYNIEQIRRAGGYADVVYSVEQIDELISYIEREDEKR